MRRPSKGRRQVMASQMAATQQLSEGWKRNERWFTKDWLPGLAGATGRALDGLSEGLCAAMGDRSHMGSLHPTAIPHRDVGHWRCAQCNGEEESVTLLHSFQITWK